MGGKNVKNTIVERVLQIIAPHPCSGCAKVGVILCQDCKYDIIHEPFLGCILCGKPSPGGVCTAHNSPMTRAFTVSARTGTLEKVINRLKFQHTKQAARCLADLLHQSLPQLPKNTPVIPVPTVRAHIRQRGYDHLELIVRHFATLRSLPLLRAIERTSNATQHTVGRNTRAMQAQRAFRLKDGMQFNGETVLLVDDIVTTGSTLSAAAQLLKDAGAIVWVATLAYQPYQPHHRPDSSRPINLSTDSR